ncbi:MAG: hypothetical protein NW201_08455 [Gemmatimonadales bacterium]|nr:hypothetical protein [Gemmatimonadales bacterium]
MSTIGPAGGAGLPPLYRVAQRAAPAPAAPARPAEAPATPSPATSIAPPPGSDPQLWAILTSEEKAYFLQRAQLGTLSYGPGGVPKRAEASGGPDAPPLGLRLDVRA